MAAWTDEESARLTELHGAGESLHFIAKDMQRSKDTVSRWAEKLGLSFSREKTAKAAEAVHIDNKARRARIEERLLAKGEEFLDQLDEPVIVFSFGGPLNEYAEHELTKPDPVSQKHIVQALNTVLTSANKLHEMNAGSNADHSKAMLVKMQAALLELHAEEDEDSSGDPR